MSLKLSSNFNDSKKCWEIELIGEIDINSKTILKDELNQLVEKEKADILFKCESLEYIDSTGLGVLISFYKNVKATEKTVVFEDLKPSIVKIFSLTGLDKIFTIR